MQLISSLELYAISKFKIYLYKALSGEKMESQNKFNKRIFVSAGMVISFIGLPASGLMNHYMGFEPMSVERHFWMSVHNVSAIFFTFFAIWHIILNRKPIFNSIKITSGNFMKREAVYAISMVLFFLTIFILHSFLLG